MRNVTLLLLLIPFVIQSQVNSFSNFKVDKGRIVWQRIFEDSIQLQDLKRSLKLTFENVGSDYLDFNKDFNREDLKHYGHRVGTFPMYTSLGGDLKGKIEFKESKYRVTINLIRVKTNRMVGLQLTDKYDYDDLSRFVIRSDNIKINKSTKKALSMYNNFFEDLFTVKEDNEDW
ncbi:hypothetical protein [Aureibaculum luteum]|uniref:hypothetical protein n=1 Tax=Aureibaculum luteum TaxID=1548456 RepID=UPI000E477007|nr:hypothetical protein [Aureibaculum luteum]